MTVLFSNYGEIAVLDHLVGDLTGPPNWTIRLFKNDVTPAHGDDETLFTEADFDGYAAVSMSGMASGGNTGGDKAEFTADDAVFTVGTSPVTTNTIYGYYVTDDDAVDKLVYSERFDTSVDMDTDDEELTITPSFELWDSTQA